MKKLYSKPEVVCQELHPETMLCSACKYKNPTYNESQQCSYEPPDLGFKIFAVTWLDCTDENPLDHYCYHNGVGALFGS